MQKFCFLGVIFLVLGQLNSSMATAATYRKATEGRDVVKKKLYPKRKKMEVSVPNLGIVMNQSYVNTYLIGGGLTYYLSESWGVSFDAIVGMNSDKGERTCIENFYFDPEDEVGAACSAVDGDPSQLEDIAGNDNTFPRFGPAYVPVREINTVLMGNMVWTPVYGKQLIFLNNTSYFDLYVELGGGLVMSTFYEKRDLLANGKKPRDVYDPSDTAEAATANDAIGATTAEVDSYGISGRPEALNQNNVMLNFGIGQKFHFSKRFHIKVYIRDQIILGTAQGFDNLLSIMGGVGFRL